MTVQEWLGEDNKLGIDIWEKKYRYNNESFDEWLDRVSDGNKNMREILKKRKALPAGRVISNINTGKKGSMANCASEGYVGDSLVDIMKVNTDIAMTFKAQGGQGLSLSKLRPKGCGINHGQFQSDGIIPFMEIFNRTTESISQGGCIAEDELVLTNKGYKKIKDIIIGDLVWTKEGYIEVVDTFDKGVQKVFEIATSKGYKIKTTRDHKFCINGFDTKRLSELNTGDKINIICGEQINENEIEFNHLAYFIGSFLANGYINLNNNGGNIAIAKNHFDVAEKIVEAIEHMGFETKIREDNNVYRIVLFKPICKYIKDVLKIHKKGAEDILIPDFIMNGSVSVVASFIGGALDNDGTIRKTSFKYSTVCKTYAEQIMKLFSMLGFFPSLHISYRDNKMPLYDITDSFRKLQTQIPSVKIEKSEIKFASNSRYSTPYTMNNTGINKNNASHLKKISKDSNIGLHTYLQSDYIPYVPMIYDTIDSITDVGEMHVYDIELKKEHLFDCNGFYVSNSRKGALLMSLDIWHKEASQFITIKSEEGRIQKANLSLEIDDEFMECVRKYYDTGEIIKKNITRDYEGNKVTYEVVPIELYKLMIQTAYDWAEPGCIFTNRFRNYNLMEFCDDYKIENCNPCGKNACLK